MTFLAVVLVCTMYPGKPLGDQTCLQLHDAEGPHQTMTGCQGRLAQIATNREVVGAAGYMLASKLQYPGPVAVRGKCFPKGSSA